MVWPPTWSRYESDTGALAWQSCAAVYTGALRSVSGYWVPPGALATSAIVCIAQLQG